MVILENEVFHGRSNMEWSMATEGFTVEESAEWLNTTLSAPCCTWVKMDDCAVPFPRGLRAKVMTICYTDDVRFVSVLFVS